MKNRKLKKKDKVKQYQTSKRTIALTLSFVVFSLVSNLGAEEDEVLFKHNNEVAFILDGAEAASMTVEPADLVFNDILEYSLQISDQYPWRPGEEEDLGTNLAGASFGLQSGGIEGAAFDSPWPDSWELWDEGGEVDLLLGMLGYGRYKITIDELVFYLNTTDGRWNWAYFDQPPTAGDIDFRIRANGVFSKTKKGEIQVHQNDEFTTWELFDYDRNRDFTRWHGYPYTWYFTFNGNSIPAAGTPSSVNQFLLDVNAKFKQSTIVNSGKTLQVRSFYNPNSGNWEQMDLKFGQTVSLTVNGTLDAQGTASYPIAFDRQSPANWYGIIVNSSSGSSSTIDYADIQHAIIAIQVNSALPSIKNSSIDNNEEGIYLNYSSVYLENNTIKNNTGGLAEPNRIPAGCCQRSKKYCTWPGCQRHAGGRIVSSRPLAGGFGNSTRIADGKPQ